MKQSAERVIEVASCACGAACEPHHHAAFRAVWTCSLEAQQREAQVLAKQLSQLHAETSRLNGLLAQAAGQRSALREDNTALEAKLTAELKVGRWKGRRSGQSAWQLDCKAVSVWSGITARSLSMPDLLARPLLPPCLPVTCPQVLEGRWAALNSSIEELRSERAEVLAAVSASMD